MPTAKTIDEVDVFTVQDNYGTPSPPNGTMTFGLYGVTDFQVQDWTGAAWATVPGGSIAGNRSVWRPGERGAGGEGGVATSSSVYANGYGGSGAINGDRNGTLVPAVGGLMAPTVRSDWCR